MTSICVNNKNTGTPMPEYSGTMQFSYNEEIEKLKGIYPIVRFYAPWGDGTESGWKTPVSPPSLIVNGYIADSANAFPGINFDSYMNGQLNWGYDQHAQYYLYSIERGVELKSPVQLNVKGYFEKTGYFSITCYYEVEDISTGTSVMKQVEIYDRDMLTSSENGNPYVINNPSVFFYDNPVNTNHYENPINKTLEQSSVITLNENVNVDTGGISFYRMDRETSTQVYADEISPDGCSQSYLLAKKDTSQEVCILRMKIPNTFIKNESPDMIFDYYQTREFSIGSHINLGEDVILDFWTVSSRMLYDFPTPDGYAYVFFAPAAYVQQLVEEQQTPEMTPPILTWGGYTGYVLGEPTFATILRYKVTDSNWDGSPINAVCYPTLSDVEPVTFDELGEYLPEMYGDTFENFQQGYIGLVNKNSAWPEYPA